MRLHFTTFFFKIVNIKPFLLYLVPLLPYLPLIVQLFHCTAHLGHDIIWSTLTAYTQVPLGSPNTLVLGLLRVQFIQCVTDTPGRSLRHEKRYTLRVRLHYRCT